MENPAAVEHVLPVEEYLEEVVRQIVVRLDVRPGNNNQSVWLLIFTETRISIGVYERTRGGGASRDRYRENLKVPWSMLNRKRNRGVLVVAVERRWGHSSDASSVQ